MRSALFFATLVSAVLGAVLASPISLEQRSSGLSCSDTVYISTDKLTFGFEGPELGMHYSDHGQLQVVEKTSGVDSLKINMRFCNSTHLGVSEDTSGRAYMEGVGYVSYGKVFLASDESKCLQRHATLPSSNYGAKTHITIEDCSNVDDSTQARQFWHFQTKFEEIRPIVKQDGKLKILNLELSNDYPQQLVATRGDVSGNSAVNYY